MCIVHLPGGDGKGNPSIPEEKSKAVRIVVENVANNLLIQPQTRTGNCPSPFLVIVLTICNAIMF